jgi:DNA mismatch endonuclease, patch repair protein
MADKISKTHRSWNMSKIRSKNTKPEKRVRSVLFKMGYRFRLHKKNLPGIPDIVLNKYHTVIFVHGCFWHRHSGCRFSYQPKSRIDFWEAKFKRNMQRDEEVISHLEKLGWKVVTIWECQTITSQRIIEAITNECQAKDLEERKDRLIRFMKEEGHAPQ